MAIATGDRLTGRDLRRLRRDAELSQAAIAHFLGVSRQRITTIEQYATPPLAVVERFLSAVEALRRPVPR